MKSNFCRPGGARQRVRKRGVKRRLIRMGGGDEGAKVLPEREPVR